MGQESERDASTADTTGGASAFAEESAHDPKWLRQTGRLLASLLQADLEDLDDFVRERLGGADIPRARVSDVRALVIQLGEALREPTPERLMGVEHLRRVTRDWRPSASRSAAAPAQDVVQPSAPTPIASTPEVRSPVLSGPRSSSDHSPWAVASGTGMSLGSTPAPVAPAPAVAAKLAPVAAKPAPVAPAPAVAATPPAPAPAVTPAPPAAPTAVAPPAIVATPRVGRLPDQGDPLGRTADGGASPLVRSESKPLPFEEKKKASPKKLSLEPHAAMGQTAPLGAKKKKSTMPFKAIPEEAVEAAPSARGLNLEQYAYFCTERALWPDHAAQTCAKYGLEPAGEASLHAEFQIAFQRDASMKEQFNQLRVQARAKLSGH